MFGTASVNQSDPEFRIYNERGRGPETWLYAILSESRAGCVAGVAAATEQVERIGGLVRFNEPTQRLNGAWNTNGTAIIFGIDNIEEALRVAA